MLLEKALRLATRAHKGQIDKAGKPYIFHLIRVSERCSTEEERIVALLHDIIEDTPVTSANLLNEGFSQRIVDAVVSVTRNKGETYTDFIHRCRLNSIGRVVKIHDLEDNMDITRLDWITSADVERLNKYLKAYKYLTR